jgi:hypothetical protein
MTRGKDSSGCIKTPVVFADVSSTHMMTYKPFAIQIRKDVDRELYGKENVITSDSVILDHCSSWINLTPRCLEKHGGQAIRVWE